MRYRLLVALLPFSFLATVSACTPAVDRNRAISADPDNTAEKKSPELPEVVAGH